MFQRCMSLLDIKTGMKFPLRCFIDRVSYDVFNDIHAGGTRETFSSSFLWLHSVEVDVSFQKSDVIRSGPWIILRKQPFPSGKYPCSLANSLNGFASGRRRPPWEDFILGIEFLAATLEVSTRVLI